MKNVTNAVWMRKEPPVMSIIMFAFMMLPFAFILVTPFDYVHVCPERYIFEERENYSLEDIFRSSFCHYEPTILTGNPFIGDSIPDKENQLRAQMMNFVLLYLKLNLLIALAVIGSYPLAIQLTTRAREALYEVALWAFTAWNFAVPGLCFVLLIMEGL